MIRRLAALAAAWVMLVVVLSAGSAVAQENPPGDDEARDEPQFYGDTELIEALRTYGLLDEWIAASPVSPQASLLLVSGGSSYRVRRQTFLTSLDAWADRTEAVRTDLARLDHAQANTDLLRAAIDHVSEALALDDRLAVESTALVAIESALNQLATVEFGQWPEELNEDPLTRAEARLAELWDLARSELTALNSAEAAVASSGIDAFVGFQELHVGLGEVAQLIRRGRELVRPAREASERLVSAALAQIPRLHAARTLASSDVSGLSVVTVDAYIRAAAGSNCSVDWALLAGIGKIESNHGRLGGASVSRSGNVSTTLLGPLLDGAESDTVQVVPQPPSERRSLWTLLRMAGAPQGALRAEASDNGFAVVFDTDGGRLDGNEQWDRAIGPMQFLPETWTRWATDGNGDGRSDPHNLYDAAAAAARFLCHLSETRGPSPATFVLGYNASTSYVRSVLSTAQRLRASSLPAVKVAG